MVIEKFQTPVIRQFSFIGYIGIHLAPINLKIPNLISLCWSIILNVLIIYTVCRLDPFEFGPLLKSCPTIKPLFAIYSQFCYRFVHPTLVSLDELYITVYGLSVLRCLDSDIFYQYFSKHKKAQYVIYAINATVLLFVLSYFAFKYLEPREAAMTSFINEILIDFTMYMIMYKQFCMCFVVHYAQYPTGQILKRIERRLRPEITLAEEDQLIAEIKQLIRILTELGRICSFAFCCHIVMIIFNIILGLCFVIMCGNGCSLVIHCILVLTYLTYLTTQNHWILRTYDRITYKFYKLYQARSIRHRLLGLRYQSSIQLKLQSRKLWLSNLDIYRDYFTFKMFELTSIQMILIINIVAFIVNYVVIITQTN